MGHLHLEPLDFLGKLDSLAVGKRSVAARLMDAKDLGQEVQDWLALVEGSGRDWRRREEREGGRERWNDGGRRGREGGEGGREEREGGRRGREGGREEGNDGGRRGREGGRLRSEGEAEE